MQSTMLKLLDIPWFWGGNPFNWVIYSSLFGNTIKYLIIIKLFTVELIKKKRKKENSKSDEHIKEIEIEREKRREELKSKL